MSQRYAIWDKTLEIIVPTGDIFTADQWKDRYPVAKTDAVIVCGGGPINGSYFGVLYQMRAMYEKEGCDFSACETDQDVLDCIEAWEDFINVPDDSPTTEERTAAALEFIALNSLPDVEE